MSLACLPGGPWQFRGFLQVLRATPSTTTGGVWNTPLDAFAKSQLPRNVFMDWDPRAGEWQAKWENGFFCLPPHLLPLLLAGRSACTASALRRSTWWRWCPWRWRRQSANSCLTSRGTRPQTMTQAVPWRSTPGSRRDWSLNRYYSFSSSSSFLNIYVFSCPGSHLWLWILCCGIWNLVLWARILWLPTLGVQSLSLRPPEEVPEVPVLMKGQIRVWLLPWFRLSFLIPVQKEELTVLSPRRCCFMGWRRLGPQQKTRKRNETELIHSAFPFKLLPKDFLETSRNIR